MGNGKKLSDAARLLGKKGGPARAAKLEAEQRKAIARSGAKAKWAALKSAAARRRATDAARAARWPKKKAKGGAK